MISKKRLFWIFLFIVAVSVFAGVYWFVNNQKKIDLKNEIPPKEIVFWNSPSSSVSSIPLLGFINPDGNSYEGREVGWIASPVTWSEGGKYLNLRLLPSQPYSGGTPFMVSMEGHVYYCSVLEQDMHYLHFRSFDDLHILLVKYYEDPNRVVLFDMNACNENETLYTARPGETLEEVVLSSQKYLAVEKSKFSMGKSEHLGVLISGPNGEEINFIPNAWFPVWSKDGEWLAYDQAVDARPMPLYISNKDGSGQKNLGVKTSGTPAWSPDGEWLVYERDEKIYKVNVRTGEEIKLFDHGISPDWRKIP
jgi:hypothetical protein